MPKYSLTVKKKARTYLSSLSLSDKNRIADKLLLLASGDFELCDIKRMQGQSKTSKETDPLLFRLRVGDFRVIYERYDTRLVIVVVKIKPRGDIYK